MKKVLLIGTIGLFSCVYSYSQEMHLKTNLLYDATTTFNLGAEFRLNHRLSLDVSGNWNPFTYSNNMKWKHWLVQPELRLWSTRPFWGHFFGTHLFGGEYNVGRVRFPFGLYPSVRDTRNEGYALGAGLTYGYRWNLGGKYWNSNGSRWAFEAEIGVGYASLVNDVFDCAVCGHKLSENIRHHYVGPTKLAVNLIYVIGKRSGRLAGNPSGASFFAPTVMRGRKSDSSPSRSAAPVIRFSDSLVIELPAMVIKAPVIMLAPDTSSQQRVVPVQIVQPVAHVAPPAPVRDVPSAPIADAKSALLSVEGYTFTYGDQKSYSNNADFEKLVDGLNRMYSDTSVVVRSIILSGYASPDGPMDVNDKVSLYRALRLRERLSDRCPQFRGVFRVEALGEDWDGMLSFIRGDLSLPYREEVLTLLDNTIVNHDVLEQRLRQLRSGIPYDYIRRKFILSMRRANCRVEYETKR